MKILLTLLMMFIANSAMANYIPRSASVYKEDLIRYARHYNGMNAPTAMYASQIHQESTWKPDAKSPYASGLTQFTPETAEWISKRFPELGLANPFNPSWAIRAMILYDNWLLSQITAIDECNDYAFALSAYNGGLGWINRDKRIATANGLDPAKYWNSVELASGRAKWAFDENRGYPKKILLIHQVHYLKANYPGSTICKELINDSKYYTKPTDIKLSVR